MTAYKKLPPFVFFIVYLIIHLFAVSYFMMLIIWYAVSIHPHYKTYKKRILFDDSKKPLHPIQSIGFKTSTKALCSWLLKTEISAIAVFSQNRYDGSRAGCFSCPYLWEQAHILASPLQFPYKGKIFEILRNPEKLFDFIWNPEKIFEILRQKQIFGFPYLGKRFDFLRKYLKLFEFLRHKKPP